MQIYENTKLTFGFGDKDHPVWGLLKPLVLTSCVALLLVLFADSFDTTEVKTIVGTLVGAYVLEAVNAKKKK
jgi:hypothetical protein